MKNDDNDDDDEDDEEQVEAGPGRHLRRAKKHHRKGGRKGRHGHTKSNRHNKKHGDSHTKSRKLAEDPEDEDDGTPSKKELLKELFAVKKQLAINEMKLSAEKKFVEVDDKAIVSTKAKLAALVKAKADKKTIAEVMAALAAEELKETEAKKEVGEETVLITNEKAQAKKLWE